MRQLQLNTNCLMITELYELCQGGDLDSIIWIMSNYSLDVNYVNEWGDTLLSAAYRRCHWHIVKYLLNHKEFDTRKHSVWLLLLDAAKNDYLEPITMFLPYCSATSHSEALMVACQSGNINVIRWLLQHSAANVNYKNQSRGMTPLSAAVSGNQYHVVKYLIEQTKISASELLQCVMLAASRGSVDELSMLALFCDVTFINECLIIACGYGYADVVLGLLRHTSADIRFVNNQGQCPITTALKQNHVDLIRSCVENGFINLSQSDTWRYFFALVEKDSLQNLLSMLITFSTSDQRNEALLDASRKGNDHLTVVRWLVEQAGADVNYVHNSQGDTPVVVACKVHQWAVVNYLVNTKTFNSSEHDFSGILIDITSNGCIDHFILLAPFADESDINDVLLVACEHGKLEIVSWLLTNTNADVNYFIEHYDRSSVDSTSDTDSDSSFASDVLEPWSQCYRHSAVSVACKGGHWNVVQYLIQSPKFDATGHEVKRLLLAAALADKEDVVQFFARHCINDIEAINDALVIASEQGKINIVKFLVVSCSADINHCSAMYNGETCLTVSCNEGNWEIVKYLVQQPNIERNVHELCEFMFEVVDEGQFEEIDLKRSYFQAKVLQELYDADDDEDVFESLALLTPEQ